MKAILVYSGKGGVGKTTTSANIAKVMAESGHKVFIIDADVNTPSMNVVFGSEEPHDNIMVSSMGFSTDGMIYIEQSMVKKFIRQSVSKAKKYNPDFLIIDTPPSITDVHINLIDSVDVSGMIMVTQPNALSVSDVNRTAMFFEGREVSVIGIVENMAVSSKAEKPDYRWELLGSIPFAGEFDSQKALENNKSAYRKIAKKLENTDNVILRNKERTIFNETITVEDIQAMNKVKSKHRFINVETWEWVREQLIEDQENQPYSTGTIDNHLLWATTDRVKGFIGAFEDGNQAYFMITKSPSINGVDLMAGEIGQGTLYFDEKYYGIPRLKYNTFQGEVTLFLHEVTPVGNREINEIINTGGSITKDGRYIQHKDAQRDLYNTFGSSCGMSSNWEEKYNRIVTG